MLVAAGNQTTSPQYSIPSAYLRHHLLYPSSKYEKRMHNIK